MKIDENFNLVGQYPEILDIGKCGLDFNELMDDPYGNLVISDNFNLKHIKIGSTFFFNNSVTIKNCNNLKSIEVYEDEAECSAKYVICKDLPVLDKLIIRSDILFLEIEGCTALNEIDLENCKKLEFLKIESTDSIKKFNIQGCIKLPNVEGVSGDEISRLQLDVQIIGNSEIMGDLSYPLMNLNFKQIENLLKLINEVGFYISKNTYYEYSISLLWPGNYTNTGNTGEVYAYELFDGSGYGEHSPEDCLETVMSQLIDELGIEGLNQKEKFDAFIKYLNEFEMKISSESNLKAKNNSNYVKHGTPYFYQGLNKADDSIKSVIQPGLSARSIVMHNTFGVGKVIAIEGKGKDERAQVEFVKHGVKWLVLTIAKLKVIE